MAAPPALTVHWVLGPHGVGEHWLETSDTRRTRDKVSVITLTLLTILVQQELLDTVRTNLCK